MKAEENRIEEARLHRLSIKERREAEIKRSGEENRKMRALLGKLYADSQAALKHKEP